MGLLTEIYVRFHPRWQCHHTEWDETREQLETGVKVTRHKVAVFRHLETGDEKVVPRRPYRKTAKVVWNDGTETTLRRR